MWLEPFGIKYRIPNQQEHLNNLEENFIKLEKNLNKLEKNLNNFGKKTYYLEENLNNFEKNIGKLTTIPRNKLQYIYWDLNKLEQKHE